MMKVEKIPADLIYEGIVGEVVSARSSPTAGTVVATYLGPATVVTGGTAVMAVTGNEFLRAQTEFLQASNQGERDNLPPRLRSGDSSFIEQPLKDLKFARSQVRQIRETGLIIDPLPILCPFDGVITEIIPGGSYFNVGDPLFRVARRVVTFSMPMDLATYLREGKTATINGDAIAALVSKREPDDFGDQLVTMELKGGDFAIGQNVCVTIKFAMWERLGPDFTADRWPLPTPPRGEEAMKLGLIERPPRPHQAKAKLSPNPFADSQDRPVRRAAPYIISPIPNKRIETRYKLPISVSDWNKWKISVATVQTVDIAHQWVCNATALDYVAPEQVLHVSSPGSGLFVPESLPANEFVSAGDCIGSLKLDDASVAVQRQYVETIGAPAQSELKHALLTSGLDERDISQIEETQRPIHEKKIFLHSDGVVEAASPERNVRSGDSLMRIRAVSMYLLRAHLPTSSVSTIPEVVRAAIHVGSESKTSVLFLNESAKVLKVRDGPTSTEFDITFPKRAGQLPPNRSWKIILEDVKSARRVLCVPDDCVVQIGKSTEVLVHSEWGKVTPTAVTVGERTNGLTEIRTGLSEGEAIVRDLHVLRSHYPNIRAIMDGFWDPSRK